MDNYEYLGIYMEEENNWDETVIDFAGSEKDKERIDITEDGSSINEDDENED
jgi:hypothetical protein